jgi:signal transduction histidine kinase
MRDAYEGLSKNFAAQKRYDSAYTYHILFTGLKDSMINEKVSREISTLEVERRDKEIVLLNQQQKLKANEAAQQNIKRNFIVGFIVLIAVISILLIYIKSRIKNQKLVFEKQLAIQSERQRISGDMHDDIGTGLSTMMLYVNMLKSKMSDKLEYADIERVSALGSELVVQMKEIVWSLNPGNDSLESLLVFIRQYFVQLFEPLPFHTNVILPALIPDIALKGAARRNIFLCVKEALNNVIKHAKADRIELNVLMLHDKLIISIKDNGAGLPENTGNKFFSNGLKNMRRRMEQINGKFQFYNEDGAVIKMEIELKGYPNG